MNHIRFIQHVGRAMRPTDRLMEAFLSLGKSGQIGANAQTKFAMCWLLAAIKANLRQTLLYQLPPVKFSYHLKDCFGFLCYKRNDRFDEFVDAFHNALLKEMPWLKGMGV